MSGAANISNRPIQEVAKDVRDLLHVSEDAQSEAINLLREHGHHETATDLSRLFALSRTWTQPKGYLHHLEQPAVEVSE